MKSKNKERQAINILERVEKENQVHQLLTAEIAKHNSNPNKKYNAYIRDNGRLYDSFVDYEFVSKIRISFGDELACNAQVEMGYATKAK